MRNYVKMVRQKMLCLVLLVLLNASKGISTSIDASLTFGGILHINTVCSKDTTGRSKIIVTSAQDASVTVVCRNGYIANVKTDDKVHYIQEIAFSDTDREPCIFEKKEKSGVYTVLLYIAKFDRDHGISIKQIRHDFLLTCTYDEKGSSVSSKNKISFANMPFVEHIQDYGGKIKSALSLHLTDMHGTPIKSPVRLGKLVKLVGRVIGPDYVRVVRCSTTNGILNHTLLTSGCGDGIIFGQDVGFTTKGKYVSSPLFPSFRLRGNPSLVFTCKFATCGSNSCDGDSCNKKMKSKPRNKRDTGATEETVGTEDDAETTYSVDTEIGIQLDTKTTYSVDTQTVVIEGSVKDPVVIEVDATEEKSYTMDLRNKNKDQFT